MSPLTKRYLLSSANTFLAVFLPLLLANLSNLSWAVMTNSGYLGLLAVLFRAIVKSAGEAVAGGHADLPAIGSKPASQPLGL